MNATRPHPGDSEAHETRQHRPETWAWSHWPFVVGLGMPFLAWGFVALRPMLLVGIALIAFGATGWVRENLGERADTGGGITPHLVLSGALVLITALFYAATLRMLVAHDLLRAVSWPEPARDLVTVASVAATLLLVLAALSAWGAWRSRERSAAFGSAGAALVIAHLAALGLHVRGLAAQGFGPATGPAGSAYYWVTALHAVFLLAGALALAITAATARRRGSAGPLAGAALFLGWLTVAWLLAYLVLYVRILEIPGARLI